MDEGVLFEQAACFALHGGYDLGAVIVVTESEAVYWEKRKRGGPKKPGGKRDKKKEANLNYMRTLIRSKSGLRAIRISGENSIRRNAPRVDVHRCRVSDQNGP